MGSAKLSAWPTPMSVIAKLDVELTKEDLRMTKVAREMLERADVNVDRLPELPISNAATWLTTYYYYTIVRMIVN